MNRYIVRFGEHEEDAQYFIVSAIDMSDAVDIVYNHMRGDDYTDHELATITALRLFDESAIIVRIV